MDNNSTKIYGVLGYPVKHSLSPLMHNAAFRALNINAEYRLFEKAPDELEGFIRSLPDEDICGINVTVPYKEKVIPYLNSLSEEAKLIAAVNTIKVTGNTLEGYNTDGDGFIRHLREDLGFEPGNKRVALLGAGGASRAVSVYLCVARAKAIVIYDVDKAKAGALAATLAEHFKKVEVKSYNTIKELNIKEFDLLVNATPVGMKESDPCLVDEHYIKDTQLVYDLVYNLKETKLLKMAKERGAKTSNGLGMLLYQGARAFEVWTGKPAPIEVMRTALNEGVNNL